MQDKPPISSTWQTPSNLAIVKYWGKKGIQEPVNPSISFSLSEATTTTRISASPNKRGGFSFRLEGKKAPEFHSKIEKFFDLVRSRLPIINHYHLDIASSNTFPHSSGIASSASAMSALAFCLADLQRQANDKYHYDITDVSSMARLGSGSAARSVYGGWNLWGRLPEIPESSEYYAVPAPTQIAPVFRSIHDDILIVSSSAKPVSSTSGHGLMEEHPYREGRIAQANENTIKLIKHLKTGNLEGFIEICESEALSLHGLMMSSTPSYTLLRPASLTLINEIRHYREKTGIPVSFTMDAGPNVHLLYPDEFAEEVLIWEKEQLQPLCEKERIIRDRIGTGPKKVIETN